jgi:hypothetical protein
LLGIHADSSSASSGFSVLKHLLFLLICIQCSIIER